MSIRLMADRRLSIDFPVEMNESFDFSDLNVLNDMSA